MVRTERRFKTNSERSSRDTRTRRVTDLHSQALAHNPLAPPPRRKNGGRPNDTKKKAQPAALCIDKQHSAHGKRQTTRREGRTSWRSGRRAPRGRRGRGGPPRPGDSAPCRMGSNGRQMMRCTPLDAAAEPMQRLAPFRAAARVPGYRGQRGKPPRGGAPGRELRGRRRRGASRPTESGGAAAAGMLHTNSCSQARSPVERRAPERASCRWVLPGKGAPLQPRRGSHDEFAHAFTKHASSGTTKGAYTIKT